jgi:hypothetical protein
MILAVVAAGLLADAPRAAAATAGSGTGPAAKERTAQEVRTVWTNEFGVAHPTGLAYEPSRGEFLVAGDGPAGTEILRLGSDEDPHGTVTLPPLANPDTLAFDETRGELTAVDGGTRIEVSSRVLTADRPRVQRSSIDGLELDAPESATFDVQTDTWFVLDEDADAVALVADDDLTRPPDRIELAESNADRLIAFNPSDKLLYVMNPRQNVIDGVDLDGNVDKRFNLTSIELLNPVAMTFAPSTDPTDDPDSLNLYVAGAGDDSTFGGVTELSLAAVVALAAPVDTATLVRTTLTSSWSPASPDPAGIVWLPAADQLAVADSEVEEVTGAGWHNVNFWRSTRTGSVAGTGAFWGPNSAGNYSREPTGLGFDAASNTLFVSDDGARRIFVVKRGNDGVFGTTDDVVSSIDTVPFGSTDTEDPEFDPVTGHLFMLDGVGREIYRIDPVDGVFGNGNDVMTQFDISHLGPTDFEGLTSNPDRRTLYVAARTTDQIFEITHDGTLVRTISTSGITGLVFISGLAMAPASNDTGEMNLWIVDRAVDNSPDPNENDGKMFEIAAPDIGGTPANQPPVAVDDAVSTSAGAAVTVPVLANDSDPNSDPLTVTNLTQPANGSAQRNPDDTVTYTPNAGFSGTDTFTYTANDGKVDSNVATVTVTVANEPSGDPPVFRAAASASITSASGTTLTIARPSGVQAGDLLLAQIRHRSTTTLTPPAGWTHLNTIAQSVANHGVYYKVAGSSEPASYAFNQGDNAGRMAGGIGAYIGVDPATPINAWAASALNTATLVAPNATSTVDNAMVVRLWGWRGPSATDAGVGFNAPPAGVTQRWSEQVGHSNNDRNRVLAGDHVKAAAGSVGTSTASGSTSSLENRRSAFTIILTPAGSG